MDVIDLKPSSPLLAHISIASAVAALAIDIYLISRGDGPSHAQIPLLVAALSGVIGFVGLLTSADRRARAALGMVLALLAGFLAFAVGISGLATP